MQRLDLPGFGRAFIRFCNNLELAIQLDYVFIRAAWIGRKIWTHLGRHAFDPRYTFLVNGLPMSQSELIAQNFRRFLAYYHIALGTITYARKGQPIPFPQAFSSTLFNTPDDYLHMVSSEGIQITITPLLDYNSLGDPRAYDIGEAFVLADNRPYDSQTVEVRLLKNGVPMADGDTWPPNNHFSDRAMPPWIGIRNLSQT
jgi:hypothetical protein